MSETMDVRDSALLASCPVLAAPRFSDLPAMANGQRIVVAANGVFVQVRLDWLDCIQRIGPAVPLALPYGWVQERVRFAFGRLPIHLIERFLDAARERLPNEAAGALVYSRGSGRLRLVMHPSESASPTHVGYRIPPLAGDETLAVDLHTHGTLPAFWSATDDRDDTGIKIAGVFGQLDQTCPSARFRLAINGLYRALPHPWQDPPGGAPPVDRRPLSRMLGLVRDIREGLRGIRQASDGGSR